MLLESRFDLCTFRMALKYLQFLVLLSRIISIGFSCLVDILSMTHTFWKMNILMTNNNNNTVVLDDITKVVFYHLSNMTESDSMQLILILSLKMESCYISFYLYTIFEIDHYTFLKSECRFHDSLLLRLFMDGSELVIQYLFYLNIIGYYGLH